MRVLMFWKDNPKTGKGKFFQRLALAFPHVGVEVTRETKDHFDVYLDHNLFKIKTKKPKILRLNGVYQSTHINYKKINKDIQSNMHKADGVIYQGEFCRKMQEKYVGLHEKYVVIPNGAPILTSLPLCYKKTKEIFVASSRWRRHKRVKEIRAAFELADIPNSKLIVFEKERDNEKIMFTLRTATALLHLSWLDWCPNSVVEALANGCPVICSNQGGTKELIKEGCGKVLPLDMPYNMKPINLYKPPPINLNKVAETMRESLNWPRVKNNFHIDIINIATQYRDFLSKFI